MLNNNLRLLRNNNKARNLKPWIGLYRGGNRYVEGWESVCWGGIPYFRLIKVTWFPSFYRLFNIWWFPWSPLLSVIDYWMIPCLENKKVWSIPYQKIEKFENVQFMFFDRYENHIQAVVHFIDGKIIIFWSSPPHKIILKYVFKAYI